MNARAVLLLAALSGCTPAVASSAPPLDEVCFSPGGHCAERAIALIDHARAIRAIEYELTAPAFLAAFVRAHARGADVALVLDGHQQRACRELVAAGVTVLLDHQHAIAHEKVIVLDGKTVISGSYNLSSAAERKNAEDMLIRTNRKIAAAMLANYEEHRGHSVGCDVGTTTGDGR
jgi:phosphatidylserine/phosphatidylglycerophosphate/cardiolipin synthase-like enzyme